MTESINIDIKLLELLRENKIPFQIRYNLNEREELYLSLLKDNDTKISRMDEDGYALVWEKEIIEYESITNRKNYLSFELDEKLKDLSKELIKSIKNSEGVKITPDDLYKCWKDLFLKLDLLIPREAYSFV